MHDNVGLGLGLAIVKKILEVHNIAIDVKSAEGEGTSFSFKLPIYKTKQTANKEVQLSENDFRLIIFNTFLTSLIQY